MSLLNMFNPGKGLRAGLVGAILLGTAAGISPASAQTEPLYGPVAENPTAGGRLNMGLLVEPPGLDPFHQAADARIRVTVLMYQGLFYEGPKGEAIPLLAESYTVSDDGLTYTIKLRQGVTFHTGAPMTAKDVAYSYNYIRNAENGSPGAGDFATISDISAVDDFTVEFKLNKPNASLPMTLGNKYGAVIPDGYFDDESAKNRMNAQSVGTGPFMLAEFAPNSHIVLDKNPDYWEKGMPYLDGVDFAILPNSASMLVALRNQRVDLVALSRPQDVQQVQGVEGLEIERWPSLGQASIDLGTETKPLDNVLVRQAISLAIDKDEIMKASIGDLGTVLGTVPAALQEQWGLPLADLPMKGPKPEEAKALLKQAGMEDGFTLSLTTINGYDWMDAAAVTLKEQLSRVGITLNIERVDLGVWINNFRSSKMGFTFNDWATQPDPNLLFYRHFHSKPEGADFRNWQNAEASALLDEGRATSDSAARRKIYNDFQTILAETVPTIMLFSPDHITVRNQKVMNYVQHPTGWYYGLARTYLAQ
ncbi:ABC transporter substrate-binding protein [Nitratireductor indicus]|uniref:Family 5 extracellular solute-binding protein n=1 Tax=Nitratireductor indicus C115 TaxID=1231190 RepID=K2N482_9HYPH|nr:ABC transporter substrate-binding protein [Nitratireductor indicus]EKF42168.1 family 5 extracellular solute-binding protein [Nitratireductor indicus C115]MDS1136246.1 ABC transporter substrate-binding protein [Nitratireductor indicus]SFQ61488.1 peptide/nickel transport system substrate-binding protein [Nitratireductor indicus]